MVSPAGLAAAALVCLAAGVAAKDPAEGWLGYATGVSPTGEGTITYIEAYWKVGENPKERGAFFSPWFGIESSDNLNLIQPVNPWLGSSWSIYNEYFQWSPVHNKNSESHSVKAGDVLFGSVTFDKEQQSYTIFHKDMNDGWSVNTTIPVQKTADGFKTYNIVYFVYEKVARCAQYPPDGEVTFYDIKVEYDGKRVAPAWTTAFVEDNCNNRAHIVDNSTIKITWDTSM